MRRSSSATATWVPAVDIREHSDHFEFCVDLPGVDPSHVDFTLEVGVLMLAGECTERAKALPRRIPAPPGSHPGARALMPGVCGEALKD